MYRSTFDSPIGTLLIEANEQEVFSIGFQHTSSEAKANRLSELAKSQLTQYFEGSRHQFDFPMSQTGTDFQREVWQELRRIDAGRPISYAELSKKMNKPLAIRAIASANGKNKLLIAVPCHRVIGSNGDLVGFSGGLWRKKWLLEHEAKMMGMGQACLSL